MKLPVLQESIRTRVLTPLITISELDLDDGKLESTVAKALDRSTTTSSLATSWVGLADVGKMPLFLALVTCRFLGRALLAGVLVVAAEVSPSYRCCCKHSVCDLFRGGGQGPWHLLGQGQCCGGNWELMVR